MSERIACQGKDKDGNPCGRLINPWMARTFTVPVPQGDGQRFPPNTVWCCESCHQKAYARREELAELHHLTDEHEDPKERKRLAQQQYMERLRADPKRLAAWQERNRRDVQRYRERLAG